MSIYRPSTKRSSSNTVQERRPQITSAFSFDDNSTDGIDKDLLFSPSNSENNSNLNSPATAENPTNKYKYDDSFIFSNQNKPTTENYLSNLISNSGDLEDSILGGLMGGPKKSVRPPTTEPISSINKSTRSAQVQLKLEPLEQDSAISPSPTNRDHNKAAVGRSSVSLPQNNALPDQRCVRSLSLIFPYCMVVFSTLTYDRITIDYPMALVPSAERPAAQPAVGAEETR